MWYWQWILRFTGYIISVKLLLISVIFLILTPIFTSSIQFQNSHHIWCVICCLCPLFCLSCHDKCFTIPEEIKSRLMSGNACYHSVQNLLSSSLLSKNLKIKIYICNIILLVVLYGCETWSLTLREERKLRVFENMVLRRIFGPRRYEVTGEWRRLHNEELSDLYSSPNTVRVTKSRGMRWAGHVVRMGEERGVYRVLVGKPEGKRPLGRPRRRWVDNIGMDLQEVRCGYMDWNGLAQDRDRWRRLVSAVMNLRVPWNAGNFLTSCKPVNFSRRNLYHGVSK